MGPLIRPPGRAAAGRGVQARSRVSAGWSNPSASTTGVTSGAPGIKVGVEPGSPFHLTECFGPVLGVMRAADLDQAIAWQNRPAYGLTAGLQGLDPAEIEYWRERVEAGNLYVNRGITGAIVRRQPFGGWKHSVVGPGAKAGGPNYVASLGTWAPVRSWAASTPDRTAFESAWNGIASPRDFTGLAAESNAFRYRPLRRVELRIGPGVPDRDVAGARMAASVTGVTVTGTRIADPRSADPRSVAGTTPGGQGPFSRPGGRRRPFGGDRGWFVGRRHPGGGGPRTRAFAMGP